MKCSQYFNDKSSRSKGQRSAPELKKERKQEGVLTFSELKQAIRDFNLQLKIGEGGFGSFYKGTTKPADGNGDEPLVVANLLLSILIRMGHKQWVAEVQFLGVVENPNLVKLIEYCAVDGERGIQLLLVYEFMQNKSLEDHLFRHVFAPFSWKTRLQMILGAAQGLAYLHEGLEVQIIYRDFKASNVLLDEKFNTKLSDFGLEREGPMAGRFIVIGLSGHMVMPLPIISRRDI
ncbi:putative receptor-like protein kinase [Hibiscus syriacus]|uniref:non-specific serine/threonine protein kinase n=1 Tax=Hibiscus syriacus TaxID=106335 RepID=A0A6A3D5B6_HIBSY|nr:putative receptor-like protein kinase [Hibiscus syriacus]